MADKTKEKPPVGKSEAVQRRLKMAEGTATFGLLVVCAGLIAPFANTDSVVAMTVFRWIYAVGAVIYLVARLAGAFVKGESVRVRRLRHMEVWAGIAFCVAAGFWFYNAQRWAGYTFGLAVMRDTVVFTLAGAVIQIIASWMLSSQLRKEQKARQEGDKEEKK